MKIKCCGAAKTVTGSCHLFETENNKFLIDCGMFQGSKELNRMNYEEFLFDPAEINFLILTHAHIDHCGLIPKLVKKGFTGKIYTTHPTADLLPVMLSDSAHIQEVDTEHENRRRQREGKDLREPLYTQDDVENTISRIQGSQYNEMFNIPNTNIKFRLRDAGHILGSAIVELYIKEDNIEKKIVCSGDLGQWDVPIIEDPTLIMNADYVFIESTYGDRLHREKRPREELLFDEIKETYKKGGKLYIPSFALERTQELLYTINKLKAEREDFPRMKIYLDSPLAIKATEVFRKHPEVYDEEAKKVYKRPFDFKELIYTRRAKDSMELNKLQEPAVIIAGSGMCTSGRIRHHLRHGLWNPKNTVLFVGYQGDGTLGKILLNGAKNVKMMGEQIAVNAKIARIHSFSAHADYLELIKWLEAFKNKPKKVFIVHGQKKSIAAFEEKLHKKGFETFAPNLGETFEI